MKLLKEKNLANQNVDSVLLQRGAKHSGNFGYKMSLCVLKIKTRYIIIENYQEQVKIRLLLDLLLMEDLCP